MPRCLARQDPTRPSDGVKLIDWWPFVISAACAGILMPLAVHARWRGHDEPHGVQKLHAVATSRLGGIVIVIACAVSLAVLLAYGRGHVPPELPLVLAAVPVVLLGLAEDLTRRVRPRYRMAAAVASAMLASAFSGGIVPRLDLPLVDDLLQNLWFVLPLTWFMVAGACNAVNLIDGAHGLAGGTALIMFGGIALAAGWSGDVVTLNEALVVMGALVGFLFWNYPRGRIFLGDAGAYFIGFMYAELSIQLIARNSGLSAWYVIMLAGYPIVDTLFAMYRRALLRRVPLMEPDALHLHSLVFRRVAMPIQRRQKRFSLRRANARVAPRLWLHSALCFALAVFFHDHTPALWGCLAAYTAFYVSQYRALVRFRGKGVRRWAAAANKTSATVKPDGA
jgi:UDP-N-acetylmuramyl pentapeptide phosphotransferase/UDP-N-acetylglucosamine-1-phosphate transferase